MLASSDVTFILVMVLLAYAMAIPLRVGLFSIAPAAFAGLGGYGSALMVMKLDVPIAVGIISATVGCMLGGAILAIPLLRIRGLFTAIATLALVVIATGVESGLGITGGEAGLVGVPFADLRPTLIAAIVAAVAAWWWVDHSQTGRRMDLAGHDVALASTLGVVVVRYRFACLTLSAGLAGCAGALYAHSFYFLAPTTFDIYFAINISAYAIVGGPDYWIGPLLGAGLLAYLTRALTGIENWTSVIVGAIMTLVVVFYPGGVGGGLRRLLRYRNAIRGGHENPAPAGEPLVSEYALDRTESRVDSE